MAYSLTKMDYWECILSLHHI